MRRATGITADLDDRLQHRRADRRRERAAIVNMAGNATAIYKLRPELADLLRVNRIVRF